MDYRYYITAILIGQFCQPLVRAEFQHNKREFYGVFASFGEFTHYLFDLK